MNQSVESVTQVIRGQQGTLFDGHFDELLGLEEPMKINVFDTPGFLDANINNIEKNKLLIATTLKFDIDVVLFIQKDIISILFFNRIC